MGRKTILQSHSIALILHKQQNSSIQGLVYDSNYIFSGCDNIVCLNRQLYIALRERNIEIFFQMLGRGNPQNKKANIKTKQKQNKKQNKTTLSRKEKDIILYIMHNN